MTDQVSNKVSWSEIASSVALSNAQISRGAQKHFSATRFVSNASQPKRSLLKRLVETTFDASLIDVVQRMADEIRENSDAKAMEACISKMKELADDGWSHWNGEHPNLTLAWSELAVQLTPHAVLTNGERVCVLYAYFRKSPPLSKDAIRALLYLLRQSLQAHEQHNFRIVVLDCYKDEAFEGTDFVSTEPWIARRTVDVLTRYAAAYRLYLDNNPPPSSGSDRVGRPKFLQLDTTGSRKSSDSGQLKLQWV